MLKIRNLEVKFKTIEGVVKANNKVSLELKKDEILGLIGETGCGKTVLGMTIMRLLPKNSEVKGEIIYKGKNLLELSEKEMREIRGKEIAIMLQNPSLSLNPVLSVGEQIAEVFLYHDKLSKKDAMRKASEMLKIVGITPKRINEYPHQFSGGMKQRIMIAIALALNPKILIADEPTKGLDSSTKEQIINLMKKLTKGKSMLLITHDLDIAEKLCDRIAVMYAGEIVEILSNFNKAKHPYTIGLLNSLPRRGLKPIDGVSPSLISPPSGCKFHPRCKYREEICTIKNPELKNGVRCFRNDKS